jgi:hypothetical protein
MDLIRVYPGEDGESHFEALDPFTSHEWARRFAAQSCSINLFPAERVDIWHPAPRRQLVIHMAGRMEMELRDGTKHVFGPGSARLMEDVAGTTTGHFTRILGDETVVQAVIALE